MAHARPSASNNHVSLDAPPDTRLRPATSRAPTIPEMRDASSSWAAMSTLCHAVSVAGMSDSPVIEIRDATVIRDGREILSAASLSVAAGDRWVVLGSNGCGKTTMLKVMSLWMHPSSGDVLVGGMALGTFDIRPVRPRLAYVSASLASELRPALSALEAVMSAKNGALEIWWHEYDDADRERALECLVRMGVAPHADRTIGSLSSGELQRVLLARALMTDPIAVLLDEPSARLDLAGREQLVRILDDFSRDNPSLPVVLVTHHVDEIPVSTTHCALVRDGSVVARGALANTLTSANISDCFGMNLVVENRPNGRLGAYAP